MGQEVDRYGRNDALGTERALDPSGYVERDQRAAYPVSLRPDGAGPAQEPLNGAAEAPYRAEKSCCGRGVEQVVLPAGASAEALPEGLRPVETLPLRRAIAADWCRRAAAVPGANPAGARVLITADALSGEVVRTVTELALRHRYLHIEGPLRRGGAVPPSAAGIRRVHRAEPGDGAGAGVCPHGL